jgi:hypothetical protein
VVDELTERNADFVRQVGSLLGASIEILEFGVSRILECRLEGRRSRLGTNGSSYWTFAETALPGLPEDTEVWWGPADSYARVKTLEDGTTLPVTGDAAFDTAYMLLGADAPRLSDWLPEGARRALVESADLHPSIRWLVQPELTRQLHVRAEPSLWRGAPPATPVQLGEAAFTVERAARSLQRTAALASLLERECGTLGAA